MKVAIITASTAIYRGQEEDAGAAVIKQIMEEAGFQIIFMKALPSDLKVLSTVMQRMTEAHVTDLIVTTGGAGCGPEDCTPEATLAVVDRVIPGIPEAMRAYTMSLTKRAMLNRCTAGIRGDVMIVNLPGKPHAVKQCLEYILPEIAYAVKVVKGEGKS